MKTQPEAVQLVLNAVGQRITTAHGYTNPYGAQCLSLIAWYTEQLGYPSIMPGYHAIDVYNKNPLNLPKVSRPHPGDIFFMDYIAPDGTSLGHTGVVTDVVSNGVWTVDENWFNPNLTNGSAAARVFHPLSQIKGYLRPTFKGENMSSTVGKYELNALSEMAFGYPANDEFYKAWQGAESNTMIRWCYDNKVFQDREARVNRLEAGNDAPKTAESLARAFYGLGADVNAINQLEDVVVKDGVKAAVAFAESHPAHQANVKYTQDIVSGLMKAQAANGANIDPKLRELAKALDEYIKAQDAKEKKS